MDILGIGFAELMFILIIAMMVFGPRRLPEIAAKAGKFVADLRNMSNGLMAEWQREITVAARLEELELDKTRKELEQAKQEIQAAGSSVKTTTSESVKSLESQTSAAAQTISRDIENVAAKNSVKTSSQPSNDQPPEPDASNGRVAEDEISPQPSDSGAGSEEKPALESENSISPTASTSVPSPDVEKVVDEQ